MITIGIFEAILFAFVFMVIGWLLCFVWLLWGSYTDAVAGGPKIVHKEKKDYDPAWMDKDLFDLTLGYDK